MQAINGSKLFQPCADPVKSAAGIKKLLYFYLHAANY